MLVVALWTCDRCNSHNQTFCKKTKAKTLKTEKNTPPSDISEPQKPIDTETNNKFFTLCRLCLKHQSKIQKCFRFDPDWVNGVKQLDKNRIRCLDRDLVSDQHKTALIIEVSFSWYQRRPSGHLRRRLTAASPLQLSFSFFQRRPKSPQRRPAYSPQTCKKKCTL